MYSFCPYRQPRSPLPQPRSTQRDHDCIENVASWPEMKVMRSLMLSIKESLWMADNQIILHTRLIRHR